MIGGTDPLVLILGLALIVALGWLAMRDLQRRERQADEAHWANLKRQADACARCREMRRH